MRGEICWSGGVKWVAESGAMSQELKSALDVTADVSNADEPPQGVTRNCGDLSSEFEGNR